MKKFLFILIASVVFGFSLRSQTTTPTPTTAPAATPAKANFDKKFRFGLRFTPQPTWFTSNDNNNPPSGAKFGMGFGLNMEFRLSDIVALSTGVGGDFEGGHYSFKYDAVNNYAVQYWQNSANEFIAPKNGGVATDLANAGNTGYLLKERSIKTTFVTIPLILKLSSSEYGGMKYFGMFGAELAIRAKAIATDSYYESYKYSAAGVATITSAPPDQSNINISTDASGFPGRVGLNAGLGFEYRLGGSTSFFMSFNYFRSFTNLMKNNSKYMIYNTDTSDPNHLLYNYVKQNIIANAVRINIGILF